MAHVHRDATPWAPYTARELARRAPGPTPVPGLNQRQWGGSGRGGWGRGGGGEWSSYSGWWGWVSDGQTSTSRSTTTAPKPTASSSSVHPPESQPTSDDSQDTSSPNQPDPAQTSDTANKPDTQPTSGSESDTTRTSDAGPSDSTPAETGSEPSAQPQTSREVQLLPSGGLQSDDEKAVSPNSQPTAIVPNVDVQAAGQGGLSGRMIALIVTSALLLLLLIALFFFFWRRRRRRNGARVLFGRNHQREAAMPRPFMHLAEASATASAGANHRISDMTMVGGGPNNLATCTTDIKHGSRGWPALAPVQVSDVGATAGEGRTDDPIDVPNAAISFVEPPSSQEIPLVSPMDGTWEDRPFHSTEDRAISRDSNVQTLGHSTRFSDLTRADPTARFSQATGTTMFSSSSANRDRELEELHTAMTQAGLNVQTLLSSLQARPMQPHELDARPPEYGA